MHPTPLLSVLGVGGDGLVLPTPLLSVVGGGGLVLPTPLSSVAGGGVLSAAPLVPPLVLCP